MNLSTHRIFGALLCFAVTSLALWAAFGRLDIVITGQGRLVPENSVRISQPVEGGAIRDILVKDGDHVVAGQPLLKLDQTNATQDKTALSEELAQTQATLARIDSELSGRDMGALPARAAVELASRRAAHLAALSEARMAKERLRGELDAAKEELTRLQQLQTFAQRQETLNKQLKDQGFISQVAFEEKQRDTSDLSAKMATQLKTIASLIAANGQADATLQRVQTDYQRDLITERSQQLLTVAKLQAELTKAVHREATTVLSAPVAGTINNLAVRAPGAVVQQGAALLTVVPDNEPLMAEVLVRNEDAGFLFPGLPVKVKLAAYPFQKYGWIDGEVKWVGADAETPEPARSAGDTLLYRARISLSRQYLLRDGKQFNAKPGMQVVADMMLGDRTLFEYLTSPLKKTVLEAARER